MQIDFVFILNFIFRVGLIVLAFFLGTKLILFSNKFANFSMYAMHEECKENHKNCEECMYYSTKKNACGIMGIKPKDWDVRNTIFTVERKDI